MDTIESQYYVKKEEVAKQHLEERFDYYVKEELINWLREYVTRFIDFKPTSREENIATLHKELQDEIYKELVGVKYPDSEILNAIITRDAPKLYTRVESLYSQAPFKLKVRYMAKRMFRRLLKL